MGARTFTSSGDIMNREQMIKHLDDGYTPEYISLLKWLELRRQVLNGGKITRNDIGSSTCALCKEYRPVWAGCGNCTMRQHFDSCEHPSIWQKINRCILASSAQELHLLTQMVNQLLFLVAVYGVYVTTRDES